MCNNDTIMLSVASASIDSRFFFAGDQMTACFILTLYRCSWCIQNKNFAIIFLNNVLIGVNRYVFQIQTFFKATYIPSVFFYDNIRCCAWTGGCNMIAKVKTKMEMWAVHHNGKFYQSVLGYYCTKGNLVDRGTNDERQIGTQKAHENTKVTSVPHWHK